MDKTSIIISAIIGLIISTIIAVLAVLFGPTLYHSIYGHIDIEFKENDLNDDPRSMKVQVVNKLGYDLKEFRGEALLTCSDITFEHKSQEFRLKEDIDTLVHGAEAAFLLSPDPLFIDLIATRKITDISTCPDAFFHIATYDKLNTSHSKLKRVDAFNFLVDNVTKNVVISRKTFYNTTSLEGHICLSCDVTINILASNQKEPYFSNSVHKFASPSETVFGDISQRLDDITPSFYKSHTRLFTSFAPCEGYSFNQCQKFLCKEVIKLYELSINCEQSYGIVVLRTGSSAFTFSRALLP